MTDIPSNDYGDVLAKIFATEHLTGVQVTFETGKPVTVHLRGHKLSKSGDVQIHPNGEQIEEITKILEEIPAWRSK